MNYAQAISLIGSLCVHIMGLLILIGEYVVFEEDTPQREYLAQNREWYTGLQDSLAVDELLNDVLGGKQ